MGAVWELEKIVYLCDVKGVKYFLMMLSVSLIGSAVVSCKSSKRAVREEDDIYLSSEEWRRNRLDHNEYPTIPERRGSLEDKMIEYAKTWLGVPYRYGGSDRSGTDCSGLTTRIYLDVADFKLPRNSAEQAAFCKEVKRSDLQPCDLVFFVSRQGGSKINHVAMYIGGNKIIHSTSSKGVIISDLDAQYWRTHFYRCGRVTQIFK